MDTINWEQFEKVEMRTGTIISAEVFAEARKPAYKLKIDFGSDIGVLKSSAQITKRYSVEELPGKQIVAVVNFPKKQIGNFMSECLVLGVTGDDNDVVLLQPDTITDNGKRIY